MAINEVRAFSKYTGFCSDKSNEQDRDLKERKRIPDSQVGILEYPYKCCRIVNDCTVLNGNLEITMKVK
jgi:hypothetical protein